MVEGEALQHKTIGKYDVIDKIGEGAMGCVYRCFDPFAEQYVAIKVGHSEQLQDELHGKQYRKLFFNEAHAASLLDHPNIVQTIDASIEADQSYIVMEYIHGAGTLEQHVRPKNLLPLHDVVRHLYKTAKAIDFAHKNGVIHRDIKPSNLILTGERDIKLADFGVAYVNRPDTKATQVMGLIGSPLYMSPEQVMEGDITKQTDIFSLGIVAYQLLTGSHPFYAETLNDIVQLITEAGVLPIHRFRDDCPASLERTIMRMLEKDPADRYLRMLDVAVELAFIYDEIVNQIGVDNVAAHKAIKEVSLFKTFTDDDISELARASVIETQAARSIIIREGESDHSFFVILDGVIEVSKEGRVLDCLSAGECFGEMGFLSRASRSATVTAKTVVRILRVNKAVIDSVPQSTQVKFYQTFLDVLIKRLGATTKNYLELIKI